MKARVFFLPIASMMAALILYSAAAEAHRLSGKPDSLRGKLNQARRQVVHDRRELQAVTSHHWTLLSPIPTRTVVHRWWLARDRAYVVELERRLERAFMSNALVRAFMCIHRGEGAWSSNTGNGYYGGLQMDYGFMRSYGGRLLTTKGTADRWTPAEQIAVAIRAYNSGRGFYPWPNTARACGLI